MELYGNCPVENVVELYKRDTGIEKDIFCVGFLKRCSEKQNVFLQGNQIVLSLYKENEIQQTSENSREIFIFHPRKKLNVRGRKAICHLERIWSS